MGGFWPTLWTGIWFAGLSVFSVLSALIIVFGGFDLVALLASLRRRHGEQPPGETTPAVPPAPMSQS